ncbi:unnamed protein product [Gemmata massiliana]|uniref:Uncharacterized protein n=1 Tax=Gemmata massiliana TaxID=1210884 RepID=A0A6P2CSB1_9BACT|nr:hypothetical protein [Gemmata massiliana]VTR91803.1 unnamed protein product [Gemmata massiliana]
MNLIVNCPGCGFRGRLPEGLGDLQTVVCPNCQTVVSLDEIRNRAAPTPDDSFPIWVDSGSHPPPEHVTSVTPAAVVPGNMGAPVLPPPQRPPEEPIYTGNYMAEEAERFSQYVAARLSELHARRAELADAESRFEAVTMQRKQELYRQQGALAQAADDLARRETAVTTKEADLVAREADQTARESRMSRSEARAVDIDRRTAELRATLDQIESRRAALAEERTELDRRADELYRAELAMHRRTAELDEMDERLRLEQEEWEQAQERAKSQ